MSGEHGLPPGGDSPVPGRSVLLREVRSAALFTASSVFLNLANLASGFLVYRWLDPYFMGIWQTMLLVQVYCNFLTLGIANGMNRELPYLLGKGDAGGALRLAAATQGFSLATAVLSLCGFAVAAAVLEVEREWRMSVATVGLVITVGFYSQYLLGTFRAKADFVRLSFIQFGDAAFRVASVALVYFFGYTGYCIRVVAMTLALAAATHLLRPIRVRPAIDGGALKALARTGLPIFAFSYLFGFADSLPRVVLLKTDAVEALGLYAPLLTLLGTMNAFFDSVRSYVYPRISHFLGASSDDTRGLRKPTFALHLLTVGAAVPVAAAGKLAIPWIVTTFIPKYTGSLEVLDIGLVIILFLGYRLGATLLTAMKSWKYLALFTGSFLVLQWCLPVLFLSWFEPLVAVAWGQMASAAAMFVLSLVANGLAMRRR